MKRKKGSLPVDYRNVKVEKEQKLIKTTRN